MGYGILRSLRQSGLALRLVGTSIHEDSPAEGFCDIFERAPPTYDIGYLPWLSGIIARHAVDLIFPGIEADVYRWSEATDELERGGAVRAVLNAPRLIALCKDKWTFYTTMHAHGARCVIDSSLESDFGALEARFGVPFLLKPRSGFGSKGIIRVDSRATFDHHRERVGPVLMAQPIVGTESEEYTTSAFCDGTGGFRAHMTLRRKLSSEGFTGWAEVVDPDDVVDVMTELCRLLKPIGPTNFQFRRHLGLLKLLEINPRVSSATSIRTAFGYNECAMAVAYFLDGQWPAQPVIRRGRAVRYFEDLVFYS